MTTFRELTARRPVPDLRIWPGDTIRLHEDGSVELRRILPPVAATAVKRAESVGDLRAAG
jgi:hypothetical protein